MSSVERGQVERYMRLPYRMEIYDDDGYWAVEFPELPGLAVGHETWEGLQAAVEDAKRAYFTAALESGRSIPEPTPAQEEFSGGLVLRLPKSLHREAARAAAREGVSLNTLIVTAVARELGQPGSKAATTVSASSARFSHRPR